MLNFCGRYCGLCLMVCCVMVLGCAQSDWETECFCDIGPKPAAEEQVHCPELELWPIFGNSPEPNDADQAAETVEGFDFSQENADDFDAFDFTEKNTDTFEGLDFTEENSEIENAFDFTEETSEVLAVFDFTHENAENQLPHHKTDLDKAEVQPTVGESSTDCIDINLASEKELMRLPGVGAGRARLIIQARERRSFKRPGDLARVKGIGPKSVKKMASWICKINPAT